MDRIYTCKKYSISLLDEGIYYASLAETGNVTLEDVRRFNNSMDAIIQKEPHVAIINISGVLKVLAEARDYLVEAEREKTRTVIAVGLITNTLMARTIGNFFVQVKPPKFPIKVFKDLDSAEGWVRAKLQAFQASLENEESSEKG